MMKKEEREDVKRVRGRERRGGGGGGRSELRWRKAGRLVHSLPGGAPRWPMLARHVRRAGVWEKHGGLAPREDLPKTKPERAALTLLDKAADIFDKTLVRASTLTFSQHGS
ncbi:hypothetical protein ACFW04_011856 [Cataglyphis niger]